MKLAIINDQLAKNDQLSIINVISAAKQLPSLKIVNCELNIATSEGVAL